MHELAITQEIVALVIERTAPARVGRVVLEIGTLAAVLPDAVLSCFDLCTEGTGLDGATLEIVRTPGLARCRACAAQVPLERPFGKCTCGSSDLDWLSGDGIVVRSVEVR